MESRFPAQNDGARWRRWLKFTPILPGATARARALACLGAMLGIGLAALVGTIVHGGGEALPWIVAPMGATAMLVFVVPASPMAQPWPVVGGCVLSALIGFAVGRWLGHGALACGLAVGLAIAAMSISRSLHPPGGAVALTGVLGGSLVDSAGWWFPVAPVALNALVLVAAGVLFHRLSGHAYPHRQPLAAVTQDPPPTTRVGVRDDDLDAVLAGIGESFDIEREDLRRLLAQLEMRVLARQRPDLTCAEIMSRDVITVGRDADPALGRQLLLESGVRLLPVLDDSGRPVGGVGLRELARSGETVAEVMTPPLTIEPTQPAVMLTAALTDGRRHAAMVVDPDDGKLLGLIAQADLLAVLSRDSVAAALSPR